MFLYFSVLLSVSGRVGIFAQEVINQRLPPVRSHGLQQTPEADEIGIVLQAAFLFRIPFTAVCVHFVFPDFVVMSRASNSATIALRLCPAAFRS